jgi:hypothetical protein
MASDALALQLATLFSARKNVVGRALLLPNFYDGPPATNSRLAVLGPIGSLFRHNLR